MNIKTIFSDATQKLKQARIKNPHLEAEILLSDILKKPREFLLAHPDYKLTNSQITNFKFQISRRIKGEPIAYITGHKEFYGLDFLVNKNVIIPRPETELMVDEALNIASQGLKKPLEDLCFIDVGTGCGCIIIALAKLMTNSKFIATDISRPALTIAHKNAKLHRVDKKIKFFHGNLLEPILNEKLDIRNHSLVILANLPYGWNAWKNNSSMETVGLKFEPPIALFAGKNGLKIIENLLKQLKQMIHTQKLNYNSTLYALIEFDPRQTVNLKQLIKKKLSKTKIIIKKDPKGHNRLVIIEINNKNKKI